MSKLFVYRLFIGIQLAIITTMGVVYYQSKEELELIVALASRLDNQRIVFIQEKENFIKKAEQTAAKAVSAQSNSENLKMSLDECQNK